MTIEIDASERFTSKKKKKKKRSKTKLMRNKESHV